MPKRIAPLSEAKLRTGKPADKDYKLADGYGLYMLFTPTGGKLWRFKYRFDGKEKLIALGAYPEVTLSVARERRTELRRLVESGIDPSFHKKADALKSRQQSSFEVTARAWHEYKKTEWSAKHAGVLLHRLERDVFPYVGHLPLNAIDSPTVLGVLRRIEGRSLEIAHQLKIAIGQIYRYSIAEGLCGYDPTPALKGSLRPIKYKHFASVTDPAQIGPMLRIIDGYHGGIVVRSACRLLPLVFTRPGELRQAEWSEIDFYSALWNIPAERMKMGQPHVVPLSRQAVAILRELEFVSGGMQYVFPTARTGRCISDMAINVALRTMGLDKNTITGHGFRAMARTVLDEVLHYRIDYIEHQLAHTVKDPLGRAYNRTTHLAERTAMMQHWADYLDELRARPSPLP